jgi:hypothetical protein
MTPRPIVKREEPKTSIGAARRGLWVHVTMPSLVKELNGERIAHNYRKRTGRSSRPDASGLPVSGTPTWTLERVELNEQECLDTLARALEKCNP